MTQDYIPLYDDETIKKMCSKTKVGRDQSKAAKEWLKYIKNKELEKEKENYFDFADSILKEILGYSLKKEWLKHERGFNEFPFENEEGKTSVVFEVKGMKTKNLFDPQGRTIFNQK